MSAAVLDETRLRRLIEAGRALIAEHDVVVVANIGLAWERGDEPTRHTPEVESTVYRLVQECLTNATRHAGAERIVIDVTECDGWIGVSVSDDGCGFDPAEVGGKGFGLTGMRERVELADGELTIDSSIAGTSVRARFPGRRRESSEQLRV